MPDISTQETRHPPIGTQIPGRLGTYQITQLLGPRGQGSLFGGFQIETEQPVTIKHYRLPQTDAIQRQQALLRFVDIQPVHGYSPDCRVIWPQEAIASPDAPGDCYLISDERDASPTLADLLQADGPLPPARVRIILDQVLQTLDFLHQQPFQLPDSQPQTGLIHGGLDLDSLLWVETAASTDIYLCDFELWERLFDPAFRLPPSYTVAQDLSGLGRVGWQLLTQPASPDDWPESHQWPGLDPALEDFIRRLLALATPFTDAQAAHRHLLQLPPPPPSEPETLPSRPAWLPWLAGGIGLGGLALAGAAWFWWPRPQPPAIPPEPRECCLDAVNAVPAGQFIYTAVEGSLWSDAVAPEATTGISAFQAQLSAAQPGLELQLQPAGSLDAALTAVQARQAAFAILPLPNRPLPAGLTAEIIAYDGMAVVVPTGPDLPVDLAASLGGQLTVEQVRQLYRGEVANWQVVGGPDLPVQLFGPADQEALTLFQLLAAEEDSPRPEQTPVSVTLKPAGEMVRSQLNALRQEQVGGIGFGPLSQLLEQCSAYPLALAAAGQAAVQPVVQPSGTALTPATNRCANPSNYRADLQILARGDYPLAYGVAVVYPQDNRLPPVGRKFAELMQTVEGQEFLQEQGLVPLLVDTGAAP